MERHKVLLRGVDKRATVRPPRCATGPRVVSARVNDDVFDDREVMSGVYHINFHTAKYLEESSTKSVSHPLAREEHSRAPEVPEASGSFGVQIMGPKAPKKPKARNAPLHHRHNLGASSSSLGDAPTVSDHSEIPFSVKAQLEVWVAAFDDEMRRTKSKSICLDLLLKRITDISVDQPQPSLFSTVTALILLTQMVPLLGSYGELMQGTIAELAAAVYLLPSKGVGFGVGLDAYAKKAFFNAFEEVRELYNTHFARATRYKSLLRLEANVLQGTIDRWGWQGMNLAFRSWRNLVRLRKKKLAALGRHFRRWSERQFVPKALSRWSKISRMRILEAQEERDMNDILVKIKLLYAQEQSLRARAFGVENERDALQEEHRKLDAALAAAREGAIFAQENLDAMQEAHRCVAWAWATVMHEVFGDAHELVSTHKGVLQMLLDGSGPARHRENTTTDAASGTGGIGGGDGGTTHSATTGNSPVPVPPSSRGSTRRRSSALRGETTEEGQAPGFSARRASVNISDSAVTFRKKVSAKQPKSSVASVVSLIHRFVPFLRESIPKSTTPEDLAEMLLGLLRVALKPVGVTPVHTADLLSGDELQLNMLSQHLFHIFLGGQCSLFLEETCHGPWRPAIVSIPRRQPRTQARPSSGGGGGGGGSRDRGSTATGISGAGSVEPFVSSTHGATVRLLTPPPSVLDAPPRQFDHRLAFESGLVRLHPLEHHEVMEGPTMVKDAERGQELLAPLETVYRDTMRTLGEAAQQGIARRAHRAAQRFTDLFQHFPRHRVPRALVETSIRSFLSAREWKRVERVYPDSGICDSVDLIQYASDVSELTTLPLENVLVQLEAGLQLEPMMRLFVVCSLEEVGVVLNRHRELVKLVMRRCSEFATVSAPAAAAVPTPEGNARAVEASADGRTLIAAAAVGPTGAARGRAAGAVRRRYVVSEAMCCATAQALFADHDARPLLDSETIHSALSAIHRFQVDESVRGGGEDSVLFSLDDTGFHVFLLYLSNYFAPDPFLSSAERLHTFLEWVAHRVAAQPTRDSVQP